MSNPLPPNTHTAPCPSCGNTLTSGVGGYLWVACGMCPFRGQVMMQPAPAAQPTPVAVQPTAQPATSNPAVAQGMPPTWTPPSQITIRPSALLAAFGISPDDDEDGASGREPTDEERWRDALRRHVNELTSSVAGALRDLPDADWRLGIEQVYERVQTAHGNLYDLLGGRRMGAYLPGRVALDQALTTALLWQVMVWHAAERMRSAERTGEP